MIWDVLVIGAGPAGSELAYRLAKENYKVLVFEKEAINRDKPCGGGIQIQEIVEFGKLPACVIEKSISNARIIGPKEVLNITVPKGFPKGATVIRSKYDRYLQERAESVGAKVLYNHKVISVNGHEVTVFANNKKKRFYGKVVVNAGGVMGEKISERVGFPKCKEYAITYYGVLKLDPSIIQKNFGDAIEFYLGENVIPHGYGWAFPKKHVISIGVGYSSKYPLKYRISQIFKKFLSHKILKRKILDSKLIVSGGYSIPLTLKNKLVKGTFLLIGDAGGFANFIHGGGIFQARKSALIASKYILSFLETNNKVMLRKYENQARNYFFSREIKWDQCIRPFLWTEEVIDPVLAYGRRHSKVQEAIGILLTSIKSHKEAYDIFETHLLNIVFFKLKNETKKYRQIINGALAKLFKEELPLSKPISYALSGGKRIRSVLALIGCEIASGSYQKGLPIAIAYELAHNASLIHDDIIDQAVLRRGLPTCHAKFGVETAILTGDFLIISIFHLLSKYRNIPINKQTLIEIIDSIYRCGKNSCNGEYLDYKMQKKFQQATIKDYLKMVGMKTGSLLEAPLVTGAIAGGGSKKIIHCLKNFGRNLGIAFQIIDDSLTIVSGNSKPKYLDILSGKVTPLLIFALNNASIKERDFILRVAGHKNAKESELKKIVRIYEKYECIKFAQSLSSKYIKEAKSSIGELKDSIPKQLLLEIAKTLDIWSLWKPR